MHHLEIDMREHIDALFNSVHLEHTDLISIGFSRPILQKCVLMIIETVIDRKLKWVSASERFSLDPVDILAEVICAVVKGTANDVGDTDMVAHVDKNYPGLLRVMGESIECISLSVDLLLRKPTWRTVDIRVIGSRAFITVGEDFRIQEYDRLKAFEQEIINAQNGDQEEINATINRAIARIRTAYSSVPKFNL
jgi:hypothetical protein